AATQVTPVASSPVQSASAPPADIPAGGPGASPQPDVDPVTLVAPEVLCDVVVSVHATVQRDYGVDPVPHRVKGDSVGVPFRVPAKEALYRLVGTIHGSDDVAYDAATQAL